MITSLRDGIHTATADDLPRIVEVWEAAVRATHHFLSEDDIEFFKPLVWQELAELHLECVRDADGVVVGFMAVVEDKIDALFVHPAWHRAGVGRRLVTYAIEDRAAGRVDVNEQNAQAVAFYCHLGFRVEGRSELDAAGKPFPLLHMRYRRPLPRELTRAARLSIRAMREAVESLERLLDELDAGMIPGDAYSFEDLRTLCASIVERQLPAAAEWGGLWFVGPQAAAEGEEELRERMSEYGFTDFFKDFVARPSDAAIAILTRTLTDHPQIARQIPRYVDALHRALSVTRISRDLLSRRGLHAFEVLSKGGVFEYLAGMTSVAPQLVATGHQIVEDALAVQAGGPDDLYRHVRTLHQAP